MSGISKSRVQKGTATASVTAQVKHRACDECSMCSLCLPLEWYIKALV